MSASEPRASSAVRNLRSLFENKQSNVDTASSGSPTPRGRSPFGSFDQNSGLRPTSKVRASFISVEPPIRMAAAVGAGDGAGDISGESKQSIPAPVVNGDNGVVEQPSANPDKLVTGAEEDSLGMTPADLTSKDAVSGGDALPPKVEDLRSPELDTSKKGTVRSGTKPSSMATKPAPKTTVASKATANQLKTSTTGTKPEAPAAKPLPAKKSSRSSLTAPTAASMARAGAAAEKPKTTPASKPKPKEVTKPVNLPSHLTAPTAASKARQELAKESLNTSVNSRVKPAATTAPSTIRPGPRTSLASRQRTGSQSSETSVQRRKPAAAASGSFLERMTKPTAASQNRHQDKPEARSPPRTKATAPAQKLKPNGKPAKQPTPKGDAVAPSTEDEKDKSADEVSHHADHSPEPEVEEHAPPDDEHFGEQPDPAQPIDTKAPFEETSHAPEQTQKAEPIEPAVDQKAENASLPADTETKSVPEPSVEADETKSTGAETPQHQQLPNGNGQALESTPAALDADETIR